MKKLLTEAELTQRNIEAIRRHEQNHWAKAPLSLKIAHRVAFFAGTVTFVVLNLVVFVTWILVNVFSPWKFDPYPFTLLTMAVSLEAIFLSTFILISQNALSELTERRHSLNLQISLLAEEENTAILKLLDKIAEKLNLSQEDRLEGQVMAEDIDPAEVLEQLSKEEKQSPRG